MRIGEAVVGGIRATRPSSSTRKWIRCDALRDVTDNRGPDPFSFFRDQICGAKTIVEAGFRDMNVDPSQGSHFFQNLTAFQVGYFTVGSHRDCFVDWQWLASQPAVLETEFVRCVHLDSAITVKMNGHQRRGVILKPS